MKKQVVCIHGGEVYETYEAFLEDLRTCTVSPTREKKKWRTTLKESLGDDFEVFLPEMPNKQNAHYSEWELWFDKYVPFLHDGVVFVGHSLGASFLLKYLSERELPIEVKAVVLISAPYFDLGSPQGGDFRFNEQKLSFMSENAYKIVYVHSIDDAVVPYGDFEKFKQIFPDASYHKFVDRGHFNQESFPELIEYIKAF